MGRPRKTVDETKLRTLALIGASYETMARNLGVNRATLERRYRAQIEEARGDGEMRILAKIFQKALAGSMAALQLCAVNRCGWSLRPETIVNVTQHAGPIHTPEAVKAHLLELQKAIRAEALRQQLPPAAITPD